MPGPLHVLVVEESAQDAAGLDEELRGAGFDPQLVHVTGQAAFEQALGVRGWDLVLITGPTSRTFGALAALEVLKHNDLDVPVIVVSPRLGEEAAVEAIKAGANDYVFTDNLARLAPAVRRELTSAQARRERRQALLARRQMVARSAFLAQASRRLASSLNLEDTLAEAVRVSLPEAADWCVVTLPPDPLNEGEGPRSVIAHRDPALEQGARTELAVAAASVRGGRFVAPGRRGAARVIATGATEWVTPETVLAAATSDAEGAALAGRLGFDAGLCVPLRTTDRVLGAITLVWSSPARSFGLDDLGLAEELATRVALAIESALLYRRAREAIRARDEFLSIAAHELNTPLATLSLLIEAMLEAGLAAEQAGEDVGAAVGDGLERARRQVKRLGRLVTNLLDVSRISAYRLELELSETDLVATVREVVDQFGPELIRAGCVLSLQTPSQLRGRWDASRLGQVLTNLLSNACKYGARKPIEVSLASEGDRARLTVRDHGIGLPENDLEQIFELFGRATSARPFSGLGLGLYVSRKVVEAHGGSIQARPAPDRGAQFEVELPLSPPGGKRAATPAPARR
jgi:signal transduction histidine kinase/FixJ family two-component response regulator